MTVYAIDFFFCRCYHNGKENLQKSIRIFTINVNIIFGGWYYGKAYYTLEVKERAQHRSGKREYEEKCRKLAQKWAIMFDRGAMNGELHRMFKDELLKNGIKKAFDVMDYFDEYID